jgi:hypothetical protein
VTSIGLDCNPDGDASRPNPRRNQGILSARLTKVNDWIALEPSNFHIDTNLTAMRPSAGVWPREARAVLERPARARITASRR